MSCKLTFSKEELYTRGCQRSFPAEAQEVAFLLGGIGTGNISIGSRGNLRDWEIFNNPGKGNKLPYSFFGLWVQSNEESPLVKIIESRIIGPHSHGDGYIFGELAGLPRLESSRIKGEYPFVWVEFEDKELPIVLNLEAFTPFVPLNADESGIPAAVIRYRARNVSTERVKVSIVGSLLNAVGLKGYDPFGHASFYASTKNQFISDDTANGLFLSAPDLSPDHLTYGSMALLSRSSNISYKTQWLQGGWLDGVEDFWQDFREDGILEPESSLNAEGLWIHPWNLKVGSLSIHNNLAPGEEKTFEFVISWYFPNRIKAWEPKDLSGEEPIERNYYSTQFENAWDAGVYLLRNIARLEEHSRDFHKALFGSTMPWYVLDAIASNITVIRSPTCFRIENGTFLAWEGCHDNLGSCYGNCTHVWSYEQTLGFLFPELSKTMRTVEFELETDDQGKMAFRSKKVFGLESVDFLPAVDGQLGSIIRLYRDWKLTGDDEFIRRLWKKAALALDFAFRNWDTDGDFVLDSQQHNTYDIEFYGTNSFSNSMFFTALLAGSEIAAYLGDRERADNYRQAWIEGSERMDKKLWADEYYIQELEDKDRYRYQYGIGCLSDQLLGQYHAHVANLGYILPEKHVKQAIKSIFKYNYKTDFYHHHNVQRAFVLNDEKGLILCSWPNGGRPKLPFIYCDEVWTGIEYQVAAHLIFEGFVDEGLTIARSIRLRQDGFKRNPFNEMECGHHYARSLASWALLIALSGFKYDLVGKKISFKPKIDQDEFKCFWSTGSAWGIYTQRIDTETGKKEWQIEVLYGTFNGITVNEDFQ